MPDLFTDEYESTKERWEKARENYEEAVRLYDAIYMLLKYQSTELEVATKLFNAQQAALIKSTKNSAKNMKIVKKVQ